MMRWFGVMTEVGWLVGRAFTAYSIALLTLLFYRVEQAE